MFDNSPANIIQLDPWTASSLLQKAIRRGETALAQRAAKALREYRGIAVWKRLITIAIEDVGIADLELVWDVVSLGTDKNLRELLGSDNNLLEAICGRLAEAQKDRSADYLYSAATKLPAASLEREVLRAASALDQLSIAADTGNPLIRRAVAAMLRCGGTDTSRRVMNESAVRELIVALPGSCPNPLAQTVLTLARQRNDPFSLMLLLLWSRWDGTKDASGISSDPLPYAEYFAGIPLYTFDKHTAVGKRSLRLLPQQSTELANLLAASVPVGQQADVALMAAFYADAVPLARRFEWSAGRLLEHIGLHADMMAAGCAYETVMPVVNCVRKNICLMNELRRAALKGANLDNRESRR